MPLLFNSTAIRDINFNGVALTKLFMNGTEVWNEDIEWDPSGFTEIGYFSISAPASSNYVYGLQLIDSGNKISTTFSGVQYGIQCMSLSPWQPPLSSPLAPTSTITLTVEANLKSSVYSSDGMKFFIVGSEKDKIRQYNLSSPYALNTAVDSGLSISINLQTGNSYAMAFSSDGKKIYITSSQDTDARIWQYTLTVAWSLSAYTYDGNSTLPLHLSNRFIEDIKLSDDGVFLFAVERDNPSYLTKIQLTTPFSVLGGMTKISATASPVVVYIGGIAFSKNGRRMFLLNYSAKRIYLYEK